MEENQIIEGPYWDYTGAANFARSWAAVYAELSADALLDGNEARARDYAVEYKKFDAMRDRITARYDATKDDQVLTYIGWRSSLDVRY